MKTMGLYLHIPFCARKCQYCDFLSAPAPEHVRQAYVEQMGREIHMLAGEYADYPVTTIFAGGGTPSVLSAAQMRFLFGELSACFHVLPGAEVTAECNPGTVDERKLSAYRESGINRLSFGLQSADETELRLLGRIHDFGQFAANFELARRMGFGNLNVDIMSALPGQTPGTYEKTVEKVLALRPEHISAYSLIIEEGTPFYSRYADAAGLRDQGKEQQLLPSEEEERRMYVRTKELLEGAGYQRYEISNYAREGFACRHNTAYWTRENYLGIGLGAASLIENVRFSNTPDLKEYLEADFSKAPGTSVRGKNRLDEKAQMEEFLFLGLRMMRGVSADAFQKQFHRTLEDVYGNVLEAQMREKLLQKTGSGYCLTDFGVDVSNYVMAQYLF